LQEEPELAQHPDIRTVFGALQQLGEEKAHDMIVAALPKCFITLEDY